MRVCKGACCCFWEDQEGACKQAHMQSCNKQWTSLPCDMLRYLKRWTAEWEADLEARPEEVKDSSSGYTATIQFQQTMSFFKPLFKQLKRRQVDCVSSVAGFAVTACMHLVGFSNQGSRCRKITSVHSLHDLMATNSGLAGAATKCPQTFIHNSPGARSLCGPRLIVRL